MFYGHYNTDISCTSLYTSGIGGIKNFSTFIHVEGNPKYIVQWNQLKSNLVGLVSLFRILTENTEFLLRTIHNLTF